MRQTKFILMIILVSVFATGLCMGQKRTSSARQKTNGKIQGAVLDINDARIVGARIIIDSGEFKRELISGSEGEFELQLPAGSYLIKAEANGFRKFQLSPFKVKASVTEMINIHMEVGMLTHRY
jgi:hypothetical protein